MTQPSNDDIARRAAEAYTGKPISWPSTITLRDAIHAAITEATAADKAEIERLGRELAEAQDCLKWWKGHTEQLEKNWDALVEIARKERDAIRTRLAALVAAVEPVIRCQQVFSHNYRRVPWMLLQELESALNQAKGADREPGSEADTSVDAGMGEGSQRGDGTAQGAAGDVQLPDGEVRDKPRQVDTGTGPAMPGPRPGEQAIGVSEPSLIFQKQEFGNYKSSSPAERALACSLPKLDAQPTPYVCLPREQAELAERWRVAGEWLAKNADNEARLEVDSASIQGKWRLDVTDEAPYYYGDSPLEAIEAAMAAEQGGK